MRILAILFSTINPGNFLPGFPFFIAIMEYLEYQTGSDIKIIIDGFVSKIVEETS